MAKKPLTKTGTESASSTLGDSTKPPSRDSMPLGACKSLSSGITATTQNDSQKTLTSAKLEELVIAPDMGLWWPVRSGSLDGFINAKYVCQAFGKNEIISETPASITVKDEGYDFAKNVHVYSVTVVEE